MVLYKILDIFFVVLHSFIIVFNLFGWIWKSTRIWNLGLLLLTLASWTLLGIWYGFGYCPFTDWHWQVLYKLNVEDLPNSYMKYILDRLTGMDWNAVTVDTLTVVFFFAALAVSLIYNIHDYMKRKKKIS